MIDDMWFEIARLTNPLDLNYLDRCSKQLRKVCYRVWKLRYQQTERFKFGVVMIPMEAEKKYALSEYVDERFSVITKHIKSPKKLLILQDSKFRNFHVTRQRKN